jgi:lipopolysaccharide transport system permease protein
VSVPDRRRSGFLATLWRERELFYVLLTRAIQARYRATVLGFVWTMLSPVLLLAVYSVVFSVYLRLPIDDYPVFLFSAFVPWLWFASSLQEGSQAILAGANLVARSRLQAEIRPAVAVFGALVHCLFSLPFVIAFALLSGRPLGWSLCALPVILGLQLMLTLGPTILLAAGNVYLRDIQQIIPPVMQALFFASPILYPDSVIPESVRPLMALNPWTYLARSYQRVLYDGQLPAVLDLLVLVSLAVVVHLLCEKAFRRYHDRLAEEL